MARTPTTAAAINAATLAGLTVRIRSSYEHLNYRQVVQISVRIPGRSVFGRRQRQVSANSYKTASWTWHRRAARCRATS